MPWEMKPAALFSHAVPSTAARHRSPVPAGRLDGTARSLLPVDGWSPAGKRVRSPTNKQHRPPPPPRRTTFRNPPAVRPPAATQSPRYCRRCSFLKQAIGWASRGCIFSSFFCVLLFSTSGSFVQSFSCRAHSHARTPFHPRPFPAAPSSSAGAKDAGAAASADGSKVRWDRGTVPAHRLGFLALTLGE